jgi:hypothetical protein
MKEYKLTKEQAGLMTEYDYTAMIAYKNLDTLRGNSNIEQLK